MTRTTLLSHARFRLAERTSMSEEELITLIERGGSIPIGKEGSKVHRLFFSRQDRQCFIAVQDEKNSQILTILSLDYHRRWKIDIVNSIKLAEQQASSMAHGQVRSEKPSRYSMPDLYITCMIDTSPHEKTTIELRLPGKDFEETFAYVLAGKSNDKIDACIEREISGRFAPDAVKEVRIKLGSDGLGFSYEFLPRV